MDVERLLALDAKGILPLSYETPEEFIERGELILSSYSNKNWLEEFIKRRCGHIQNNSRFKRVHWPTFGSTVEKFHKGVNEFGKVALADLSWVPVIGFIYDSLDDVILGQSAESIVDDFCSFRGAVFMTCNVAYSGFYTGAHEAFHTIRHPIRRSIELAGASEFDHLGALAISSVRRLLVVNKQKRQFRAAWWRLHRAFGEKAMYVLARLSYDELIENILERFNNKDPREYFEWMAAGGPLRHRIIAYRLGIDRTCI